MRFTPAAPNAELQIQTWTMPPLVGSSLRTKSKPMPSKIQRRFAKVQRAFKIWYQNSYPRNKILAIRSRKPTERFFASAGERFVVFLVPSWDFVNGGTMSIFSIASETRKLLAMNGVSVAICTAFSHPRVLRYTKFDNDFDVLAFDDLLQRFPCRSEVLVHIPEFTVERFGSDRRSIYLSRPDIQWRFNILLQNINSIPRKEAVEILRQIGPTTATIAHKAYATAETAQRLGCPTHFLSWRLSPEDFGRTGYISKKKLIVISPDREIRDKNEIVRRMSETLPDHDIVEVRNMTYREYRDLIKCAKFTFTFGEGLDAYFIETIFYGGVSMAVFDERFFTPEYRDLDGVFDSAQVLSKIADFLRVANNKANYEAIAGRQYDLLSREFKGEEYKSNIRAFYSNYFPEWSSRYQGQA